MDDVEINKINPSCAGMSVLLSNRVEYTVRLDQFFPRTSLSLERSGLPFIKPYSDLKWSGSLLWDPWV